MHRALPLSTTAFSLELFSSPDGSWCRNTCRPVTLWLLILCCQKCLRLRTDIKPPLNPVYHLAVAARLAWVRAIIDESRESIGTEGPASWPITYQWPPVSGSSWWCAVRVFSSNPVTLCNCALSSSALLSVLGLVTELKNLTMSPFVEIFVLLRINAVNNSKVTFIRVRGSLDLNIFCWLTWHFLSAVGQPQWPHINLSDDTNTTRVHSDSRPAAASFLERKACEIWIQPPTAVSLYQIKGAL